MLCSSLAFAVMGALVHSLRTSYDWPVIFLARVSVQLLLALALALAAGVTLHLWKPGILWLRSCAGSISMVCMFYAFTRLPASDVIVLANMFPIWVALLAWPWLGQPPSLQVWIAVASGVTGVFLVQQPEWSRQSLAYVLALLSSMFTAIAYMALHRLGHLDARAVIVHFSSVALVVSVVCLFVFERSHETDLDGATLLRLLGVGASALVAQLLLTRALAEGHTAKVSVVGLTQIAFALVIDVLIFGYRFTPVALLGMALIVAPTAWLILRAK
jgi:drug/metabolite transporter (DMT)-like permease